MAPLQPACTHSGLWTQFSIERVSPSSGHVQFERSTSPSQITDSHSMPPMPFSGWSDSALYPERYLRINRRDYLRRSQQGSLYYLPNAVVMLFTVSARGSHELGRPVLERRMLPPTRLVEGKLAGAE